MHLVSVILFYIKSFITNIILQQSNPGPHNSTVMCSSFIHLLSGHWVWREQCSHMLSSHSSSQKEKSLASGWEQLFQLPEGTSLKHCSCVPHKQSKVSAFKSTIYNRCCKLWLKNFSQYLHWRHDIVMIQQQILCYITS